MQTISQQIFDTQQNGFLFQVWMQVDVLVKNCRVFEDVFFFFIISNVS